MWWIYKFLRVKSETFSFPGQINFCWPSTYSFACFFFFGTVYRKTFSFLIDCQISSDPSSKSNPILLSVVQRWCVMSLDKARSSSRTSKLNKSSIWARIVLDRSPSCPSSLVWKHTSLIALSIDQTRSYSVFPTRGNGGQVQSFRDKVARTWRDPTERPLSPFSNAETQVDRTMLQASVTRVVAWFWLSRRSRPSNLSLGWYDHHWIIGPRRRMQFLKKKRRCGWMNEW